MLHEYRREYSVLAGFNADVAKLTVEHEQKQKLWFPSDLLLREHVPKISPAHLLVLKGNTLTEEGLPSFHRLLSRYLGESEPWIQWTDLWTAEEDRHGAVLHDYLIRAPAIDMVEVERMQYSYLRQAFRPDWEYHPYQLVAYTVLQERATQISHANLAVAVKADDPVLARILGSVAGEEGKHCRFYKAVFAMILERDPNGAVKALQRIIMKFEMPGANIPEFDTFAYVAARLRIFDTAAYRKIVEETIEAFSLSTLTGLNDDGARSLKNILRFPKFLERLERAFDQEPRRMVVSACIPGWQEEM